MVSSSAEDRLSAIAPDIKVEGFSLLARRQERRSPRVEVRAGSAPPFGDMRLAAPSGHEFGHHEHVHHLRGVGVWNRYPCIRIQRGARKIVPPDIGKSFPGYCLVVEAAGQFAV